MLRGSMGSGLMGRFQGQERELGIQVGCHELVVGSDGPPPVFPYVLVAYGFGFSTGKVSTVVFPSAIFLTLGCGSINHPSLMMNSTVTFGLTTLFGAFFSLEEVVDLSYNLFVRTKCSQTLQDCVFCASPWGCLFLTFV